MSDALVRWIRSHNLSCAILTILRLLIGYKFLMASLPKLGNALWTGDHSGSVVTGFIQHALSLSQGPHAEVSDWYAWFLKNVVLPHPTFFSSIISWGELLTGIALIIGCFTNFAALMSVIMNLSYLLAGVSGPNPLMLVCGLSILFGGYNAARLGLDYWVAPWCKQMAKKMKTSCCKERKVVRP